MAKGQKKVALVTGASSGMGKAIAQKLLKDGLIVVAAARRVGEMEDLKKLGADVIEMDVSKEESMSAGIAHISNTHGGVDVLINNAGFGLLGAVEDIPADDARYQFEVNVFGGARLVQLVLPHMREKKAGKIVFITSMGGKIYTPMGAWYHASKHALEGLADCLRLELSAFKIDVVVVEPGIIQTEFGHVTEEPLIKYSGDGPYAPMARNVAGAISDSYANGKASSASLIAKVVSRAVKARRPKTRYAAGQLARPLLFIRKWFGDRIFDRAILSAAK